MKLLDVLGRTISPPVVVAILALVLAACAPGQAPSSGTAVPPSGTAVPPSGTAAAPAAGAPDLATGESSVQVADNQELGQILVTADGMTLYTFAIDEPGVSNCTTNACVTFWPPATVEAQPSAGPGVPGTLSTLTRSDGSMQLTYNGSPLYTFALDKNPGDAKGEGVNEFGGVWNAVPVAGAS
jgi:predicted lipoprotein with Yx(FWY)xxD motif